ncbi:TBC1 domain family member 19 [Parasteatoda tepidariorum]|nr:TBC1 domain family member 19 [Parasteatoda tepidariorum]XP_042906708.1 TBC1 domain family member 19 [Parasteatoda tepidariorum]XP_042906709.1 TBC1 domain family member 19 [Parasteatoda tepidariorum]XP_042906710.1 TBC1 domain family member 19 [Parasteatoda tepidariorum]
MANAYWPQTSTNFIASEIEKTDVYRKLLMSLQELILDPEISSDVLEDHMRKLILDSGYKQKLRNLVYQHIVKNPSLRSKVPQKKEPLEYIKKAQENWEHRITKSLNNMSNELSMVFSRKRPVSEQIEFEAKWSELGSEDMDLSRFRPVYSPKDFLEVLTNVKCPNVSANTPDPGPSTYWGLIKVPLNVKSFYQLRLQFEELSGNIDHLGLNILPFSNSDYSKKCLKDRVALGKRVLEANHVAVAREYCKKGCPDTLRAALWSLILGVDISGAHKLNFKHLKSCVFQHDLLIDKLIFKDIHLTASNDDQYFVFEDLLYQILLVFSRDTSVQSHFEISSANPVKGNLRGTHTNVVYPPNGVIPFHGFSMYVAPLCYIYEDPITLYHIFRELYVRYFFRLHNLSSHPQGVLSLALSFETLLDEVEPQLAYHFSVHDIYPLKIAVKWIIKAFSGCLATDQILQLWDCMLAYDSTEIIVVLAVGIMSLRKSILLQAENQATVENILADISAVKVIPILHGMLNNSHHHSSYVYSAASSR